MIGHGEVRAYWTRQWGMIDPHVEPLAFVQEDSGRTAVTVHQVVGEPDCSGRALRRALYSGMPDETLSLAGSRSR
ncbi:MAG: hypothetical protein ACJ8DJ_19695 [Gemmatimonadales bacterium]